MTYQQSYWVQIIGTLAGIFLVGITLLFEADAPGVVGLVILFAANAQTTFFHRCPSCGRYVRPMIPEYRHCPHCGEQID